MIDIHTHILPHIDDGAKDSATAIAMLNMEREQGVDTLLLSPHYYGKTRSPKEFLEKRGEEPPRYETVKTGKDHAPMFYTTAYALGESAKGEGKSKKDAESLAAARLLWELTKSKKKK